MYKIYNSFNNCASNFNEFFSSISSLSKNQSNFLGLFLTAMLKSNSVNFDSIADELVSVSNSKSDSIIKRISRFLNNKHNSFHSLFDNLIIYIFNNFNVKHDDNRVYISFDHMFVRSKFTVFMLSIRIGKQGFPIFFSSFPGIGKPGCGDAFKLSKIKDSLLYVHNLIKSIDPDINIVFLADRWFGNFFPLFNFIDNSLHDSFVFRCKDNFKIFYFDKKENHNIWCSIHDLPAFSHHSSFFYDLPFTFRKYKYNLTICKSSDHQERWYLISNIDPTRAKKIYGYRFGGIETIFKNQKSNGFYLEKTGLKHLHSFDNLYSLLCISVIFYICLGTEISKNSKCYKNLGFRTVRHINNHTVRVVSLFKSGLRLFKIAFNSPLYHRLPFRFILYDI